MIEPPRQAVILAGGLGSRLRPLTNDLPKPMISFHGRPFLEHLIEMLREAGISRVLVLVGYRGNRIIEHFGDGSRFGLEIQYSIGAAEDETGTRLRCAQSQIDARFILMCCDNYWPLDLVRLTAEFERQGRRAVVTVYSNKEGRTRDNVRVAADGQIVEYDKSRRASNLAGVDIGFCLLEKSVLAQLPANENVSFEGSVYPRLVAAGALGALVTDQRYYSVGSLDRLTDTERFLGRSKAVLLDRDGTLNVRMPPAKYVTSWSSFHWEAGALAGLRALTQAGYRIGVITNQPGVARGFISPHELDSIHSRMVAEARSAGGDICSVFVCPHGWDDGCECRKPRPGLLFRAQRELRLDLTHTPFIGDDICDGQAALAGGLPFVHVGVDAGTTILDAINAVISGERPSQSIVSAS